MTSPYIKTYLFTTVSVHPSQMDNNIKKYIKSNLIKSLQGKCFHQYGFITKIYETIPHDDAIIVPEDPTASAMFKVKFSCGMCYPLNDSVIVGTVKGINQMMIYVTNGPIQIIINTKKDVNKNIFAFNGKINAWIAKKDDKEDTTESGKKFSIVKPGTYVKVRIKNKKITDKDHKILCLGILESLATDEEANKSIADEYAETNEITNIEEYVENDKMKFLAEDNDKEQEQDNDDGDDEP